MVVGNGSFVCGHLSQPGVFLWKNGSNPTFFGQSGVVLLPGFLVICQKIGYFLGGHYLGHLYLLIQSHFFYKTPLKSWSFCLCCDSMEVNTKDMIPFLM